MNQQFASLKRATKKLQSMDMHVHSNKRATVARAAISPDPALWLWRRFLFKKTLSPRLHFLDHYFLVLPAVRFEDEDLQDCFIGIPCGGYNGSSRC